MRSLLAILLIVSCLFVVKSEAARSDVLVKSEHCRFKYNPEKSKDKEFVDVWCFGENFMQMAKEVMKVEPHLYPNPKFEGFQRFVLDYQDYATKEMNGGINFFLFFNGHPQWNSHKMELMVKVYERYTMDLRKLWDTLFVHIVQHNKEFEENDVEGRRAQLLHIDVAMIDIIAEDLSKIPMLDAHNCDYIAQPLNALWFLTNGMRLLDLQGQIHWGSEWVNQRNHLHQKHGLPGYQHWQKDLEEKWTETKMSLEAELEALERKN